MAERLLEGGRSEVVFLGTPDGLEARLVPEAGIEFVGVKARGFDRSHILSLPVALAVLASSSLRVVGLVRRRRPDVVVGFGGYVSVPVGIAAVLTRTPLVLLEQNSVPGMANRLLSRWARAVGVTYASSGELLAFPDRAVLTGNPVRSSVLEAVRDRGRAVLRVPDDAVVLLVFGGSRGARHLNRTMVSIRERLLSDPAVHIVHVAGRGEVAEVRTALGLAPDARTDVSGRYHVYDYVEDMGSVIAAADLVLARAGATSIAEITALGRPAVLVPYPHATDDHQTTNARAFVDAGGAVMVRDRDLDGPEFVGTLTALLADAHRRATMAAASATLGRPDAAHSVVRLIEESAGAGAKHARRSE